MSRRLSPPRGRWGLAAIAYTALIVYGSLYPFSGWTAADVTPFAFLTARWPSHLSRADVVTNVLAYMPFGLLLGRWCNDRGQTAGSAIAFAALMGVLLSFAMESLQQFLPARVASVGDIVANTLGTIVGAIFATVTRRDSLPWAIVMERRQRWFLPGRLVDLGLMAIALWTLSQLTPLVPSLDLGNLRHGLSPLWQTLQHPGSFNFAQWATYELYIAGLALLAVMLGAPGQGVFVRFFAFVAAVLLCKVVVVTRQLSLEAILGAVAALVLALPFLALRQRTIAATSILFIVGGFTIAEMASGAGSVHPFNWIPFAGHLENPLIGIASILEEIWPAAALAVLARRATPPRIQKRAEWIGLAAIILLTFVLEWFQQYRPGRFGDFTVVMLAAGTWLLFWSIPVRQAMAGEERSAYVPSSRRGTRGTWAVVSALAVAAATGAGGLALGHRPQETRVDESRLPKLPQPEQLPPVSLPGFRYSHPRLPSPSTPELLAIQRSDHELVRETQRRAAGSSGDIEAAALQELLEPGSVDLRALHQRLMALKFTWRGHDQLKPLAVAYDWLYSRWDEQQRVQLREKLVEGCNYVIGVIRDERLSPYNVILYNAPLQALMACSLAVYGDDPHAEPVMRFTYDLWKNRVLPVWRQVMGQNGGWHEGGEYVGIGIGQAIYELPAMWLSATGENFFESETGIRGFADFLVYRTRPDGTHYRWGDGSAFDRIVPDATALALESHNVAAYNLRPPAHDATPSAWPWGPLTDTSLNDPNAPTELPLARVFDGIGMLVARSDWTPDATYVTFKAGDNYWSHSHLDQGAFTIYKGGALAIDSGLYGPSYGSDHHMNYTYQTIAHNVVTVTDPEDTVPAPGKDKPRPIANDGGQRRIGSGWGIEAAPLDLEEWQAKRDIYHTGALGPVLDQGGLSVAAADITPAYTNAASGGGTFSARTRRVERFWRIFGFDRIDDVVVVFDQVTATKASFRKRWLLHTIEEPMVSPDGFVVSVAPAERPGRRGGSLYGKVLLPRDALINPIGGRGLEFFVDDRNYDEAGKLAETIRKLGPANGEPGAWRIEISPGRDAKDDVFLVVLLPVANNVHPLHKVHLLQSGNRVGCEVVGPNRTTRWWFEPGRNRVEIEIVGGADSHHYQVSGPENPPPADPSYLALVRRLFGGQ